MHFDFVQLYGDILGSFLLGLSACFFFLWACLDVLFPGTDGDYWTKDGACHRSASAHGLGGIWGGICCQNLCGWWSFFW